MKIYYSKRFFKNYRVRIKSFPKLRQRFAERINLFINNPGAPILRDHKLIGHRKSFRAFSITGDIRIIYAQEDADTVILIDIGTHAQVYN